MKRSGRQSISRPFSHASNGQTALTRLLVSNLHHDVSESDLRQLFEEVGPLHKVSMRYDRAGRSEGSAEIHFFKREHAQLAIETYHEKPLDGQNLHIEIMEQRSQQRRAHPVSVSQEQLNKELDGFMMQVDSTL